MTDDPAALLPYRKGAGIVLFNRDGKVFVGRRISRRRAKNNAGWQMPQGAIDGAETPREAVFRELAEETGTDKAEIIAESPRWLSYDLPPDRMGRSWGGKYRGQTQKWFALRFTGSDEDFNLEATAKPEFSEWKWVGIDELLPLIVGFKRGVYEAVVAEFRHLARPWGQGSGGRDGG
ncbi:MAG: RNA pyrophosphohydrolase [Rhodospirillales bacterium]|nr:RNA pyrophosphohydrolase [Rhodospirillales bacterium]